MLPLSCGVGFGGMNPPAQTSGSRELPFDC